MKMSAPDPPTPPPPVVDPMQQQLDDQAKQDSITALQDRLQGDTSSLMARYGSQFAMSGGASGGGGAVAAAAPTNPAYPIGAPSNAAATAFGSGPFADMFGAAFKQMGVKV